MPSEVYEKRLSMSDTAEWARENDREGVTIDELEALSQDMFGQG